jgi:hypothetical protein
VAANSANYQDAIRRRLTLIDQRGDIARDSWQQRFAPRFDRSNIGVGGYTPVPFNGKGGGGNEAALVAFAKSLQRRGYRVSEHPSFGGVTMGAHTKNSAHYSGRAFDLNRYPGTSGREQRAIDKIIGEAARYGLKSIWRAPNHYNHAHIYF